MFPDQIMTHHHEVLKMFLPEGDLNVDQLSGISSAEHQTPHRYMYVYGYNMPIYGLSSSLFGLSSSIFGVIWV